MTSEPPGQETRNWGWGENEVTDRSHNVHRFRPRPVVLKVVGWFLGIFALCAAIPALFFALGVIHLERVGAEAMWLLALLTVGAVVLSLRVAFPWPAKRSEYVIRRSARRAVILNGLVAVIFIPWASVSLLRFGMTDTGTQVLVIMATSPLFLLGPILWHFQISSWDFWTTQS
jgi:hypothetical protein